MKNWDEAEETGGACQSERDREDARQVSRTLGVHLFLMQITSTSSNERRLCNLEAAEACHCERKIQEALGLPVLLLRMQVAFPVRAFHKFNRFVAAACWVPVRPARISDLDADTRTPVVIRRRAR